MKKHIFTLLLVCSYSINSQTVNGIKIEEIPEKYVALQIKGFGVYKGLNVFLDYGQMREVKDKKGFILDNNGKKIEFNSPINAINFLAKRNFKLMTNSINWTPYSSIVFENLNYKKTNN